MDMPDLIQSLQGRDLGHLRIVAELWRVPFDAPDARVGLRRLAVLLLDAVVIQEMLQGLPSGARQALDDLLQNDGRLTWTLFTRRYGSVREVGPVRRDRDRPYGPSASPAEALWYRALVARAFFDMPAGPEEFAYIPDDWLPLMPAAASAGGAPLGRPASPSERANAALADERLLDHACTLLAALRLGLSLEAQQAAIPWQEAPLSVSPYPLSLPALQDLLSAAGQLDVGRQPLADPVRAFLEADRGEALAILVRAWLRSRAYNELRLLPGLSAEGEWHNDALRARQAALDFLSTVPADTWWSLAAFISAVRQEQPDFQRPAGDYDSWYIRDVNSGEYLRGFEHWEDVDGAVIRFMICGPLHWLGLIDLAVPFEGAPAAAFRWSGWAASLLRGEAPAGLSVEDEALSIGSDGSLRVPRHAPRAVRYQAARFCTWSGEDHGAYLYQLTPASLERARQQGLRVSHLMTLLRRHTLGVPANLARALERWDEHGVEARMEKVLVLRLSTPEMLQSVRASKAARFLEEPLGPTAVIVKPGAWQKVMAVLTEMGYLGEIEL